MSYNPTINVKKLFPEAKLPYKASAGSAGYDLYACGAYTLLEGKVVMVGTGLAIEIPYGWEAQIRIRSGLAAKGIIIPNAPGTIDSDYRGEVKVLLMLTDHSDYAIYKIEHGDRVAQIVFARHGIVDEFNEVEDLTQTERDTGGFGSTGV